MAGKTVYVVVYDTLIQGIFTARKAAEAVVNCEIGEYVAEYELDYGAREILAGLLPWAVEYRDDKKNWGADLTDLDGFEVSVLPCQTGLVWARVWAKDEQDAIAKAREMYAQYPAGYPVPATTKPQEYDGIPF